MEQTAIVSKEQTAGVGCLIAEYLDKGNGNPASAEYLLAVQMIQRAKQGFEPDEVTRAAYVTLHTRSLVAIAAEGSALASCRQTGALTLATTALFEWCQKDVAYRLSHPLKSESIELESMKKRYVLGMDDWVG